MDLLRLLTLEKLNLDRLILFQIFTKVLVRSAAAAPS